MRITGVSVWAHTLAPATPQTPSGGRLRLEVPDGTLVRVDTDVGPWG